MIKSELGKNGRCVVEIKETTSSELYELATLLSVLTVSEKITAKELLFMVNHIFREDGKHD